MSKDGKSNKDYKRRTWKIKAKFFKIHTRAVPKFKALGNRLVFLWLSKEPQERKDEG